MGGAFANIAKNQKRRLSQIIEIRQPGIAKAFKRVGDFFQAQGKGESPVSLLQGLTPGLRSAAILPGVQSAVGAGLGVGGRAAGEVLPGGGALLGAEVERRTR